MYVSVSIVGCNFEKEECFSLFKSNAKLSKDNKNYYDVCDCRVNSRRWSHSEKRLLYCIDIHHNIFSNLKAYLS